MVLMVLQFMSRCAAAFMTSAGTKFYGPGKAYNHFVGRDAFRAFATGCRAAECVSADLDGLSPSQLRELDRWMEMYETHDKYTFVGTLVEDPVGALVEDPTAETPVVARK